MRSVDELLAGLLAIANERRTEELCAALLGGMSFGKRWCVGVVVVGGCDYS